MKALVLVCAFSVIVKSSFEAPIPTTITHRFHASIQDIERLGGGDRGVVPTLVAYTYFILSVVSLAFLLLCMYIFCSFRSSNLLRLKLVSCAASREFCCARH